MQRLRQAYPDAACALTHENPFQLLVATILSAQCTDARVNMVTPALFAQYPDPAAMSQASQESLEAIIRSTGFYRNKAKSILAASRRLGETYGGVVPRTMEELLTLQGVARKTANVVLGVAYGIAAGVVVDTHVDRIARRLGLTRAKGAEGVEQDLMRILPKDAWIDFSHLLIFHGRRTCLARKPKCGECALKDLCPSAAVFLAGKVPAWERAKAAARAEATKAWRKREAGPKKVAGLKKSARPKKVAPTKKAAVRKKASRLKKVTGPKKASGRTQSR
ncbi:MAG: endonuclease III [Candidatus Eiseniibacteriota bacterium]